MLKKALITAGIIGVGVSVCATTFAASRRPAYKSSRVRRRAIRSASSYWYAGATVGANFAGKGKVKFDNGAGYNDPTYKLSYNGGLFGGYKFSQVPMRAELGLSYVNMNIDKVKAPGGSEKMKSAYTRIVPLMARGFYDLPTMSGFTPYVGLGVGYARVDNQYTSKTYPVKFKSDYNVLAYQGILGTQYKINRNLSLTANYTYISTLNKEETTTISGTSGIVGSSTNARKIKGKQTVRDNLINVGVVYNFC